MPPEVVPTPYCCAMRAKFLLGIVAENKEAPHPPEMIDFVDWDQKRADARLVIRIKFCPFCGKPSTGPIRTVEVQGCECTKLGCDIQECGCLCHGRAEA